MTTLAQDIDETQVTFSVAGDPLPVGARVRIGEELVIIRAYGQGAPVHGSGQVDDPLRWIVDRAQGNTVAAAHSEDDPAVQVVGAVGDDAIPVYQWTSFDPVWSTAGDPPDIGDGYLIGRYLAVPAGVDNGQRAWTVDYWIQMGIGSTTDVGTGGWSFSPPPFTDDPTPLVAFTGTFAVVSESGGTIHAGVAVNNGSHIRPYCPDGTTQVDETHPFEWSAGSTLQVNGRYQGVAD